MASHPGPITLQEVIDSYRRQQGAQKSSPKSDRKQTALPMRK